jgi:hypothetical protein
VIQGFQSPGPGHFSLGGGRLRIVFFLSQFRVQDVTYLAGSVNDYLALTAVKRSFSTNINSCPGLRLTSIWTASRATALNLSVEINLLDVEELKS